MSRSKVLNTTYPLSIWEKKSRYWVRGWVPVYRYVDEKRTDEIIAFKYQLVSMETCDSYEVSVPHLKPVITADELKKLWDMGEKPVVELKNATIRAYFSTKTQSYLDSCKAEDIILLEDAQTAFEL